MIDNDAQFIYDQVRMHEMKLVFDFTAIYGLHTIQESRKLWGKLQGLVNVQQGPWLAMGGFQYNLESRRQTTWNTNTRL